MSFPFRNRGRGVRRVPGQMNKLEAEYGRLLETRKLAREIEWYTFDALKLRLAENTFYTPDYFVMTADGTLEVHEVKGFWEDDARVKIKCAAEKFPFRFVAVTRQSKKNGGAWEYEKFGETEPV